MASDLTTSDTRVHITSALGGRFYQTNFALSPCEGHRLRLPCQVPFAGMSTTAHDNLRAAMALHEQGDIDRAIAAVRLALEVDPDFADALSYLGSTLITRKGHYTEGLAEMEKALEAAPEDPTLQYTAGWCNEFVAHRVSRRPQPGLDPTELYARAERQLRRCLELRPDAKIRDDAKDLLATIIKEDVE